MSKKKGLPFIDEFRTLRRRQLAKAMQGRPDFSDDQIEYLASIGVTLPDLPPFRFWFEEQEL